MKLIDLLKNIYIFGLKMIFLFRWSGNKKIRISYCEGKKEQIYHIPIIFSTSSTYRFILMPLLKRLPAIGIIRIKLPELRSVLYLRSKTTDIKVFEQVFVQSDLDFSLDRAPILIVDGGANTGFTSVFFANTYPNAKTVAIEPDADNYRMLVRNAAGYPNIRTIHAALWHKRCALKTLDRGMGEWVRVVVKTNIAGEDTVWGMRVDDIISQERTDKIDLLKLDIEGSEIELFSDENREWIEKTDVILIELHDFMRPGCSKSFYKAIENHHFVVSQTGEKTLAMKVADTRMILHPNEKQP